MDLSNRLSLTALAVMWSGGFLFVRIAAPVFGPVALVSIRVLIAGLILALWVGARGDVPPFWRRWREYLVLGALNVAFPFTLIAWAALTAPASLAAIMMATVPLFSAPIAAIWLQERISRRQVAGLLVGFIGVALLVGFGPIPMTPALAGAIGALLAAAAFYALGGVYTARRFTGAPPLESTIGQQFASFLLLLPFTLIALPGAWPTPEATFALLVLAIFPSAVAYLLFFRLITAVGAVSTATVSYLIPLFGAAWGVLLLGEPVGPATIVGMIVILAGVLLATGPLPALARPRVRPAS